MRGSARFALLAGAGHPLRLKSRAQEELSFFQAPVHCACKLRPSQSAPSGTCLPIAEPEPRAPLLVPALTPSTPSTSSTLPSPHPLLPTPYLEPKPAPSRRLTVGPQKMPGWACSGTAAPAWWRIGYMKAQATSTRTASRGKTDKQTGRRGEEEVLVSDRLEVRRLLRVHWHPFRNAARVSRER